MAKYRFFRQQVLPLGQQLTRMALECPGFKSSVRRAQVTWIGLLTPSKMSATYTIRVTYNSPRRPVVEVIAPRLRSRPGERIPHTFKGEKLCLHLHEEWSADMVIASTIIKWAAFWLLFYETWFITGKWEGGGHMPLESKKDE